jgi:hypothetical protein
MQYSFRLAEVLGHLPDPRRRPGTIKSIVEYTGLDRHQVAALLKNEIKYVPLKALSRLCDYLIEYGYATADQLPGALFAVEPESFWEMLARRRRLEFCLGVRREVEEQSFDVSYVVASDSVLMGELLNGVTTLGGTARLRKEPVDGATAVPVVPPHPEHLKQSLVWSPGQASHDLVRERAEQIYRDFSESKRDKALVCLGSTKSNPVVELVLANAFGAEPFVPQDDCAQPTDRSCPFFIRYRESDPHPPSCVGGLKLSKSGKKQAAGIYYEDADGQWQLANPDGPNQDAAMVFYIHRESQGRLEMALGGFSGRATRLLARSLATRAQDYWPPVYAGQGIQIGAFIVEFTIAGEGVDVDIMRTDASSATRVIPLAREAVERRLGGKSLLE